MSDTLQSLLQNSISHSPQALAWGQVLLKAENRFNGLHGVIEKIWPQHRKPLKRLPKFHVPL